MKPTGRIISLVKAVAAGVPECRGNEKASRSSYGRMAK